MIVFTFRQRYWAEVRTGAKTQTIRTARKRLPQVGDTVSLRGWVGAPYRSKQMRLRPDTELTAVLPVKIERKGLDSLGVRVSICVAGYCLDDDEREALAVADGFASFDEMLPFFVTLKNPSYSGHLYKWSPRSK